MALDASGMDTTKIGMVSRRSRQVTDRDIALFTEMSSDRNPLHGDATLAARSRVGAIVVGGVTSALSNRSVAEQLPGPGIVFLEVGWRCLAPVRPGDLRTARATVITERPDEPVTTPASDVTTQPGVPVLDGTAVVWRDPVVAAANGAPHHHQEGAGPSGVTTRRESA